MDGEAWIHHLKDHATQLWPSQVASGGGVNGCDRRGLTWLMCAAAANNVRVLRWLIQEGADVDARRSLHEDNTTALLWAVDKNCLAAAVELLAAGASPNVVPTSGVSILQRAISNRNGAMARLLVEHGADTAHTDRDGNTAVHTAANSGNVDLTCFLRTPGDTELLVTLVRAGGEFRRVPAALARDVNEVDGMGRTALMYAVGSLDTTYALLNADADPNIADRDGNTALLLAVPSRYARCLLIPLVMAGARVDHANRFGYTAARMAAVMNLHRNLAVLRICGGTMPAAEPWMPEGTVKSLCYLGRRSPLEAALATGIGVCVARALNRWEGSTHDGIHEALVGPRPARLAWAARISPPWRLSTHRACSRRQRDTVRALLTCLRERVPFELFEKIARLAC